MYRKLINSQKTPQYVRLSLTPVFSPPVSSVCPEQRRSYMSARSEPRRNKRSWRKWRGIYPCTHAQQEEVRLWLAYFLFFLERPVEHQAKLCFTVVTITSFKPGRSHTHVPHCSVSVCHSYAKHASTQYKWDCVNVLLECVFLFWLKVQHCKHSMMLTGSCYFPDDAYPPFVYRTACIRRVHRTRVHLVISTPLLINNNDLTLGFRGTFEKTPPWK